MNGADDLRAVFVGGEEVASVVGLDAQRDLCVHPTRRELRVHPYAAGLCVHATLRGRGIDVPADLRVVVRGGTRRVARAQRSMPTG